MPVANDENDAENTKPTAVPEVVDMAFSLATNVDTMGMIVVLNEGHRSPKAGREVVSDLDGAIVAEAGAHPSMIFKVAPLGRRVRRISQFGVLLFFLAFLLVKHLPGFLLLLGRHDPPVLALRVLRGEDRGHGDSIVHLND